jgi:tRNA U38,U39,U40 pseudouridine synthase TruA
MPLDTLCLAGDFLLDAVLMVSNDFCEKRNKVGDGPIIIKKVSCNGIARALFVLKMAPTTTTFGSCKHLLYGTILFSRIFILSSFIFSPKWLNSVTKQSRNNVKVVGNVVSSTSLLLDICYDGSSIDGGWDDTNDETFPNTLTHHSVRTHVNQPPRTVKSVLLKRLEKMFNSSSSTLLPVVKTSTSVHALSNLIMFETSSPSTITTRTKTELQTSSQPYGGNVQEIEYALNRMLPPDIALNHITFYKHETTPHESDNGTSYSMTKDHNNLLPNLEIVEFLYKVEIPCFTQNKCQKVIYQHPVSRSYRWFHRYEVVDDEVDDDNNKAKVLFENDEVKKLIELIVKHPNSIRKISQSCTAILQSKSNEISKSVVLDIPTFDIISINCSACSDDNNNNTNLPYNEESLLKDESSFTSIVSSNSNNYYEIRMKFSFNNNNNNNNNAIRSVNSIDGRSNGLETMALVIANMLVKVACSEQSLPPLEKLLVDWNDDDVEEVDDDDDDDDDDEVMDIEHEMNTDNQAPICKEEDISRVFQTAPPHGLYLSWVKLSELS